MHIKNIKTENEASATPINVFFLFSREIPRSSLAGQHIGSHVIVAKTLTHGAGKMCNMLLCVLAENGATTRWRRMETLVNYLQCAMCMRRFSFLHRHVESVKKAMQVSQHSISAPRHQRRFCNRAHLEPSPASQPANV